MVDNCRQKRKLVDDLDNQIFKIEVALNSIKESIDAIQVGDGNDPYWNGTNAYNCVNKSLNQIDYNYNLLNNLNKCIEYLDSLSK